MATKLTTAAVLKYTPHETRREIADTTAGLHLIIQPKPSGTKSWALRFRRPDGRPAKLTLGPLDTSDRENAEEEREHGDDDDGSGGLSVLTTRPRHRCWPRSLSPSLYAASCQM